MFLKVELLAGTDIADAATQMGRLANKLEVTITADFNGVSIYMKPFGDIEKLVNNYSREIQKDTKPKKVWSH